MLTLSRGSGKVGGREGVGEVVAWESGVGRGESRVGKGEGWVESRGEGREGVG